MYKSLYCKNSITVATPSILVPTIPTRKKYSPMRIDAPRKETRSPRGSTVHESARHRTKTPPLSVCTQVNGESSNGSAHQEYILDDDECPLAILMNHPSTRGESRHHSPLDCSPRVRAHSLGLSLPRVRSAHSIRRAGGRGSGRDRR